MILDVLVLTALLCAVYLLWLISGSFVSIIIASMSRSAWFHKSATDGHVIKLCMMSSGALCPHLSHIFVRFPSGPSYSVGLTQFNTSRRNCILFDVGYFHTSRIIFIIPLCWVRTSLPLVSLFPHVCICLSINVSLIAFLTFPCTLVGPLSVSSLSSIRI